MHEDDALFGDPRPTPAPLTAPTEELLPDWQVSHLRTRLDALGLTTMDDRKALIEELAGHPVESLRHLAFSEAIAIDEELTARKKANAPADAGSAWDNRDEDTWIDLL